MRSGDQLIGDFANLRAVLTVQPTGTRVVIYKLPKKLILYESHIPIEESLDYAKERALAFFACELDSVNLEEIRDRMQWSMAATVVPGK